MVGYRKELAWGSNCHDFLTVLLSLTLTLSQRGFSTKYYERNPPPPTETKNVNLVNYLVIGPVEKS